MITAEGLTYRYNKEVGIQFPDFSFQTGDQALILGQSGCGKTTLMHLISGLLKGQTGFVKIDDTDISKLSGSEMDRFRGKNIGIVFQTPHFIEALTVSENLEIAQTLAGHKKDKERVREVLSELSIEHKISSSVKDLSQGEKQRVSIARAIINKPSIILADEPTSALDDTNCEAVVQLLKQQAEKNKATLLIVTHDNRLKEVFTLKLILS
jgi:ABC-type lipoprotein export system ATPase subunit